MRTKEIAKDGISYEDRDRLANHIFDVQSCPDCQLPDKWSFTLCDRHWNESEELEDLIDVDKLVDRETRTVSAGALLSEYWDERIEERRKPKKKEAVTMQELKDSLKKEKITAEEHIQSVKNCIDCVAATVDPKGLGENQGKLCGYHKGLLREDGRLQRILVDTVWGSYKSVDVKMALEGFEEFKGALETCNEKMAEAVGAFKELAKEVGQETPEVNVFRSSMYGTFVRDSRR